MQRSIVASLVILLLLAGATPVLAGGWAAVRLDAPPDDVRAGVPWRFGFMVLQHDVTPNSDVTPIVRAIHRESGEEVTTTAVQEGPTGHFVAELTLPQAGEWRWEIEPAPFAATSFESLTIVDPSGMAPASYEASILDGACANPGVVLAELDQVAAQPLAAGAVTTVFRLSVPASMVSLDDLGSQRAVQVSDGNGAPVACGDVLDPADGTAIAGLRPVKDSGLAGLAVLQAVRDAVVVTLYVLPLEQAPEDAETIEILDDWLFSPAAIEATQGTTITWTNASPIAHTVTVDDLAFDDSGLIEPGASFSLTFDEPGTYHYRCSPHPGMEGVIVIA